MWIRIVIGVSALCFLTGCGNAVGDSDNQNVDTQIEHSTRSDRNDFASTYGALPNTVPPASIADLQTRIVARLKKGLDGGYFPNTVPDPERMLRELVNPGQSKGWVMVNGNRRLYLVKRHLRLVPKTNPNKDFSKFCDVGKLYSGYVAPRPFTELIIQTESLQEITANPYGLLVCDHADTLKLKLLNANHPIFET